MPAIDPVVFRAGIRGRSDTRRTCNASGSSSSRARTGTRGATCARPRAPWRLPARPFHSLEQVPRRASTAVRVMASGSATGRGLWHSSSVCTEDSRTSPINTTCRTSSSCRTTATGINASALRSISACAPRSTRSSFVGVEGELGVIPTKTKTDGVSATVWTYRAHLIAQYPGYRLVPFVVLGLGGMSLKSHADTLGNDSDPEWHFGVGAKWAFNEYLSARVEVRDNLMQKNRLIVGVKDGDLVSNTEFLLGLSFTLGRTPYEPTRPPVDSDGDGFFDQQDACPLQPGVAPNGCPAPVVVIDTDKDGIPDASDSVPDRSGRRLTPRTQPTVARTRTPMATASCCPTTSARPRKASRPMAARSGTKMATAFRMIATSARTNPRRRTASKTPTVVRTNCPRRLPSLPV